jgi:hypothetical protein
VCVFFLFNKLDKKKHTNTHTTHTHTHTHTGWYPSTPHSGSSSFHWNGLYIVATLWCIIQSTSKGSFVCGCFHLLLFVTNTHTHTHTHTQMYRRGICTGRTPEDQSVLNDTWVRLYCIVLLLIDDCIVMWWWSIVLWWSSMIVLYCIVIDRLYCIVIDCNRLYCDVSIVIDCIVVVWQV